MDTAGSHYAMSHLPRRQLGAAIRCCTILGLLLAPCALAAQRTPPAPMPAAPQSFGRLTGVLVDSIHMIPLAGATILVGETTRWAVSDEDGNFQVDSIRPGEHVVSITHPLLDSLYMALATRPVRIAADSVTQVSVGVPSLATLLGGGCPPAMMNLGPSIFAGRVLDPESKQPATGVRVSLVWTQLSAGTDIGVRRLPRVRTATTDARGFYRICGVAGSPDDLTVQAERGRVKTAEVPVAIGEGSVGIRSLLIRPATDSVATTGGAVAAGVVVDTVGKPVENAQVSVEGAASVTATNAKGEFSLAGLPSGTEALVVRRIGFAPARAIVDLAAGTPVQVAVRLERAAQKLEQVVVTAQAEALSRVGFEDRRKRGMGHYLGPDDISRMQPTQITSALRTVPGLSLVPTRTGGYAVRSARDATGGCVSYWVDGAPFREMSPGELDAAFPASQLAAVETYQPGQAPAQFTAPGESSCVTIVIWTQASVRRGRTR